MREKHNAEFTKGGRELWSYFKPFVDQSSRNFHTMYEAPCPFQRPFPVVCVTFYSEDIRHKVSKSSKIGANANVLWPPILWEGRIRLLYGSLLGRLTTNYLAKFGWVPFADLRLRSLAMKQNAEFTEGG